LGIEPAPDQWVAELGLNGVLVLGVVPGSPAAKAGIHTTHRTADGQIELGDLILAIDGQAIESADDLLSAQENHKVGDTVTVVLLRDGQRQEVKITLAVAK
jgi:S1-C subfamily serine protease